MHRIVPYLFLLFCLNCFQVARSEPQQFLVGLSPDLDTSVKDDVYRRLVRLMVQELPLDSTLALYDASNLKSIAEISVPSSPAFSSAKTRANQFAAAIGSLKRFLAQSPSSQRAGEHVLIPGAIRLPQFCDFLSENLPAHGRPMNLLLLGSPLYQDEKEPAFSMVDGYFPSDGHLQATRETSVYGFDGPAPARRLHIHWVYFGAPWVNELHRERVTRFWTLYLARRGGSLETFTGDLPTAFKSLLEFPNLTSGPAAHGWTIASGETKLEMLRVSRQVEIADWLTNDLAGAFSQRPPSALKGPMKIGIRWSQDIDLDLYAKPRPGGETLFFQHVRSPEGYYYKDHRSSPGREYEFIEFEAPVAPREVEAYINFYRGNCPGGPTGEVRVEFDGRIYGGPFALKSSQGNRGRTGSDEAAFWVRIPVQELLKLNAASASLRRP